MNTFTITDINILLQHFNNSNVENDSLKDFIESFSFENIYEPDKTTIVFDAGGRNQISIEITNYFSPLSRKLNIQYREKDNYISLILEPGDLPAQQG